MSFPTEVEPPTPMVKPVLMLSTLGTVLTAGGNPIMLRWLEVQGPAPPVVKPAGPKTVQRVAVRLPAPTPVKAEAAKPALFTVDVFMGQKKETIKFEVEPVVIP